MSLNTDLENTDHVIDDNCRLNQPELVHYIDNTTFVSKAILPDQCTMLNNLPGTVAFSQIVRQKVLGEVPAGTFDLIEQ